MHIPQSAANQPSNKSSQVCPFPPYIDAMNGYFTTVIGSVAAEPQCMYRLSAFGVIFTMGLWGFLQVVVTLTLPSQQQLKIYDKVCIA